MDAGLISLFGVKVVLRTKNRGTFKKYSYFRSSNLRTHSTTAKMVKLTLALGLLVLSDTVTAMRLDRRRLQLSFAADDVDILL
jgi:hypothetical protein